MGGNGSTARKVSFGLDEDEKVTVIEGVKLSDDVLKRMREAQVAESSNTPPPCKPDSPKPPSSPEPTGSSASELQQEIKKNFGSHKAPVEEQLATLAQKEKDPLATTGFDYLSPALVVERAKAHEEKEKAKLLARRLERKEQELASISTFYKDQLEILEKKNLDSYKETAEQYNQAAAKAETRIWSRQTASVCTELQAKVLQCYKENPQQSLHCSGLAKQYMTCVQQAKKSSLTNHG